MIPSSFSKSAVIALSLITSAAQAGVVAVSEQKFGGLGDILWEVNLDKVASNLEEGQAQYFQLLNQPWVTFSTPGDWVSIVNPAGPRNLLTSGNGTGFTADYHDVMDVDLNMISFRAANIGSKTTTTFIIETNEGKTYSFSNFLNSDQGGLKYFGFSTTGGETISALHVAGNVGLTDIQVGIQGLSRSVSAVPEPSSFLLFGAGMALIGATLRRNKTK